MRPYTPVVTSSSGLKSGPAASSSFSLSSSASSAALRRFVAGGLESSLEVSFLSSEDEGASNPRLNENAPENIGLSVKVLVMGVVVEAVVQTFVLASPKEANGFGVVLTAEKGFTVFGDALNELNPPPLSEPDLASSSLLELFFTTSNGLIFAYELNPKPLYPTKPK